MNVFVLPKSTSPASGFRFPIKLKLDNGVDVTRGVAVISTYLNVCVVCVCVMYCTFYSTNRQRRKRDTERERERETERESIK